MSTPPHPAHPRHSPDAVAGALVDEARLLDTLADTFRRQRAAIARDDATALDDAVFAANRIMHTMAEARRRRRALVERLVGDKDVALDALPELLGHRLTDTLHDAIARIQSAAGVLAREVETNRRLLSTAIDAGERQIRALCGGSHHGAAYDARAVTQPAPAGAILNRHA